MAPLLQFATSRRRVESAPAPLPPRAELMALINNLQIITLRRPAALKVCARVAKHYADYIRRRGA